MLNQEKCWKHQNALLQQVSSCFKWAFRSSGKLAYSNNTVLIIANDVFGNQSNEWKKFRINSDLGTGNAEIYSGDLFSEIAFSDAAQRHDNYTEQLLVTPIVIMRMMTLMDGHQ